MDPLLDDASLTWGAEPASPACTSSHRTLRRSRTPYAASDEGACNGLEGRSNKTFVRDIKTWNCVCKYQQMIEYMKTSSSKSKPFPWDRFTRATFLMHTQHEYSGSLIVLDIAIYPRYTLTICGHMSEG